jgi:hypothetical protein
MMTNISDAVRASRYRRKLEDLWKASGDFISLLPPAAFTPEAREAYERLDEERRIIRNQLDVEEQFARRTAAQPSPVKCYQCGQMKVYSGEFCDDCTEANADEQPETMF